MDRFVAFSGLGSLALFSDKHTARIASDASSPAGQILISSCHEIFLEEVLRSKRRNAVLHDSDFRNPENLINPPPAYQRKAVVQFSTLCLAHLLRYLHLNCVTSPGCNYATGMCVGLLPAIAAATSSNLVGFLKQALKVYRLALLVGIATDEYHETSSLDATAFYVDDMMFSELSALVEQHRKHTKEPLYISSKLSRSSFILSGTISGLTQFKEKRLGSRNVKSTNINSFYHNESILGSAFKAVLDQYRAHEREFPSCAELQASIISTADGKIIDASSTGSLLELVLSCIFLQPIDWVAVNATSEHLGQSVSMEQRTLLVDNYGPGHGAGKTLRTGSTSTTIRNVTFLDCLDVKPTENTLRSDIAIVGMASQLPDADDCEQFWINLEHQRNSCREIPGSRFNYHDFYVSAGQERKGRTLSTKWGNFLNNPFAFDSSFFAVSPREALSMDPQQRVMLKVAHQALENAGYAPDSTPTSARDTFACYIAVATHDYVENLRNDIDVYYTPGTHRAFLSGRISYFYQWSGPSITVDTVCSSSMTAINLAVRALQTGDCRSALVGGVNTITSPDMFIGLDRAHFLSPSGQCKSFDASADGYCRAEGCGAVVLKTLEDALAENDQILGIIRSSELGHSGNASSITHPHSPTQIGVIQRLLRKSGVEPNDVSTVEAHGTGTPAGDPSELNSITNALCSHRTAGNSLYVTSHKANIGHTEAASGLIATIKMCLMFKYGRIPPQALLTTLKPQISGLDENFTVIPSQAVDWTTKGGSKRLGVVNNFGAAGSIGAILMEEPPDPRSESDAPHTDGHLHVLCLSAKTDAALELLRDHVKRHLRTINSTSALGDFCYTLSARRIAFEKRITATGRSASEIHDELCNTQCVNTSKRSANAVFVFSGQGSQYLGMGRALVSTFKPFHDHVMYCHQFLQGWKKPSCLDVIMSSVDSKADNQNLSQVQAFQSALFVLEVGLARLFISWGIQPLALVGHSLGEYAALVISEVLSLEDGLRLVSYRAQLLADHCTPGLTGMLAVNAAESTVTKIIRESEEWHDLSLACDNSPNSCVVGGPNEKLKSLSARLSSSGNKCSLLDIPFAYHTEHLESVATKLTNQAQKIELRPVRVPVVLNAIGAVLNAGEQLPTADYFAQHSRHKVRFTEGIADIQSKFSRVKEALWVEIGPHASILPIVRTQIDNPNAFFIPSLDRGAQSAAAVVKMLEKIFEMGLDVSWRQYFEDLVVKPRLISAPGMPFQEDDYVTPYVETKHTEIQSATDSASKDEKDEPLPYRFLSRAIHIPPQGHNELAEYETDISVIDAHITGHTVCDVPLCPSSVFQELALSATAHSFGVPPKGLSIVVENVIFAKPLVTSPDCSKLIITQVRQVDQAAKAFQFEISSKEPQDSAKTTHCSGSVKLRTDASTAARTDKFLAETEKIKARIEKTTSQIFSRRTIYDRIFSRVVAYSSLYQSIDSLKMNSAADECVAECTYPPSDTSSKTDGVYVADPVLIDTVIHTAGFLCNMRAEDDEVFIGHSVEEACLLRPDFDAQFEVRCANVSLRQGATCIGDAIAIDSKGVVAVIRGIQLQKVPLTRMSTVLSQAMPTAARSDPVKKQPTTSQPGKDMPGPAVERPPANQPSSYQATPIDHEDAVIELIAAARNAPKSSINPSMSLDELGIDSLLLIEMESSLQKMGSNRLTSVDLEKCVTVEDIVQLVNSEEPLVQPELARGPDMVVNPTKRSMIPRLAHTDHQYAVLDIISKACNTPKPSINLSMSLDALGIDSLLMLEMEKPFRQIGGSNQFTAVDFERCITVGDIVDLINSADDKEPLKTDVEELHVAKPAAPATTFAPKVASAPPSATTTTITTTTTTTTLAPSEASASPLELSSAVIETLAKTCRMDPMRITHTTALDDLGIDSLMMLELEDKFHELSPNGFKTMDMKDCQTISDMIDLVAGNTSSSVSSTTREGRQAKVLSSAPVAPSPKLGTQITNETVKYGASKIHDPNRRKRIPMDPETEQLLIERLGLAQQPELLQSAPAGAEQKPAVFLIHAGSGFSRPYYRLSSLVDRDIWAIHDDKLLKQEEPWNSVTHVAQTYADLVRQTSKGQPVIISGWSFGGIVAYEVTKLLQREGRIPVLGLVLVDPPPPDGYTNPRVAELLQRLFIKIFGANTVRQTKLGNAMHEIAASNAIRCANLMETYVPTSTGKPPRTAYLYAIDPVTTDFLAEEGDEHAPYDAWLCEREDRKLALGGWFELLGEDIKIIDLPGNHYNILERDKVETTSSAYIQACEWIESGSR